MRKSPLSAERVAALDEVGDPAAAPGSHAWAVWVRDQLQASLHDNRYSAERLQGYRDALRRHEGWRKLTDQWGRTFASYRAFCKAQLPYGLGMPPEMVDALAEERKSAQERSEKPLDLAESRRPTTQEQANKSDVIRLIGKEGGTGADYLTARIARDHPAILARMQSGEFSSVRAAALEAGIVKPRLQVEPSPEGFARAIRRHFTPEQIEELVRLLEEPA